jgi:hypothetical protein
MATKGDGGWSQMDLTDGCKFFHDRIAKTEKWRSPGVERSTDEINAKEVSGSQHTKNGDAHQQSNNAADDLKTFNSSAIISSCLNRICLKPSTFMANFHNGGAS